jgi:glycosyltransferase involved in cell wall biosynthesis
LPQPSNDRTVSIILPVQNQQDHIGLVVDEYVSALEKLPSSYELLLVTNGCKDQSAEICAALAQRHEQVRHVDTPHGGWGHAVIQGLRNASGDTLCYTNSARTSSDVLLLALLYAHVHPDVIIKANRKIRENWRRRLGSLLYNLECRALFDLPVWDINGTPKVFPRSFDKLMHLTREDDLIDAEFNVICRRESYPILEVPILSARRFGGASTTNVRSALRMYLGAYELWRTMAKHEDA